MPHTYTRHMRGGPVRRLPSGQPEAAREPSVTELAAGAAPTPEQTGHRVDLPGEIREKMESSFGADFSNVKLYESQTVADAGARAVTQGNNIAFAPGQLDLASTSGQALLGHELSHVVSQARGESAGRGFLNDPGLEAQADRQGMMAARGESAYSGPVSPVGVSAASSAAGPMQAKKNEEKADIQMERTGMAGKAKDLGFIERRRLAKAYDAEEARRKELNMPSSGKSKGIIPDLPEVTPETGPFDRMAKSHIESLRRTGNIKTAQIQQMSLAGNRSGATDSQKGFLEWYNKEFRNNKDYEEDLTLTMGSGHSIGGLNLNRSKLMILDLARKQGMDDDEIKQMMRDLMVKRRKDAAKADSSDPEEQRRAGEESQRTDDALRKLKGVYHGGLKSVRDKYGVMLTQLHPEDASNQAGDFWVDSHITQDCMQLLTDAPELFDPNNEDDQEFNSLNQYYMNAQVLMENYGQFADAERVRKPGQKNALAPIFQHLFNTAKRHEANVLAHDKSNMPQMRDKEMRAYRRKAIKEHGSMGLDHFFESEDESKDMEAFAASDMTGPGSPDDYASIEELRRRKAEKAAAKKS